jgi:hypothetical protein
MSYVRSDINRPDASIAWMIGGGRQHDGGTVASVAGTTSDARIKAASPLRHVATALAQSLGRLRRLASAHGRATTAA